MIAVSVAESPSSGTGGGGGGGLARKDMLVFVHFDIAKIIAVE